MDGLEVCRYLRREPTTARIPIIAVSAHSESPYKAAATKAGADQYLVKPVMLEDLEQALAKITNGHQASVG